MLTPLLHNPQAVTWAVHILVLDCLWKVGLTPPPLGPLLAIDNIDLITSVLTHR